MRLPTLASLPGLALAACVAPPSAGDVDAAPAPAREALAACPTTCAPELVAADQDRPASLAADAAHLYWTTGVDPQWVNRLDLTTGAATVVRELRYGWLTADATDVYYTSWDAVAATNRLTRVALGDGASDELGPGDWAVGDATDLYWTDGATGKVFRRARSGGPRRTVARAQAQVGTIAMNATHVYWGTDGAIRRASKATGSVAKFATAQPGAREVAIGGDAVFWYVDPAGPADAIRRRAATGGPITTLAGATDVATPRSLRHVDGYVYWVNVEPAGQTLRRVPATGGTVETLATAAPGETVLGYALDADYLYVADPGAGEITRRSRCACGL